LTVLASGGGLGDGGADVHDAAFDDLAINDAGHITEILNASLLQPWLRAMFPGQEILAYFEIKAPDKSDVAALADTAVKVNSLGHKV
ncbi:phage portal protein family protein, partial [Listeria monocytogenes]|uniref:phage portal protein family protein n=1 Tax=Listeria monocytogenes TaxID=1639 RepID=UPI002FDBC4AA